MDRLLLAGTNSGCGKTTVTLALIAALRKRGKAVSAFKCGPDYIDPMFHRRISGVSSHNLDPFFCGADGLRRIFAASAGEISVVEGVMGYYDGVGPEGKASAFDVAGALEAPVVLVMDAKGMAASAGAVLQGFLRYRENSRIRGVVFNGLSEASYPMMAEIARRAGVTPFGFLPRRPELSIESRRLGLVTADEIEDIDGKIRVLGGLAEAHMDVDGLIALSKTAPSIEAAVPAVFKGAPKGAPRVKIAVSRDRAFCFMYRENIELLEALGCEIVYFSPLEDARLTDGVGGLYLCGGYPELYARELSENASMRRSVKERIGAGLPTIAECGGFLYLHDEMDGYPMAGVIRASAFRTERLRRFGYITIKAERDNLLCKRGGSIRSHEFHYYDSTDCGSGFTAFKASGSAGRPCVHATESLYAGFPHLYFPANPAFAENFAEKAVIYGKNH